MKLFRKKYLSPLTSHLSSRRGFTLIELLITIAIVGVLAAGILVAIDPVDKINQANDSKVQGDISGVGRATEAYATTHGGFYPAALADLVSAGELKRVPVAPTGYTYTFTSLPAACTAGTTCTSITLTSPLKSKNFTATPFWRYESSSGKSCAVATAATVCP